MTKKENERVQLYNAMKLDYALVSFALERLPKGDRKRKNDIKKLLAKLKGMCDAMEKEPEILAFLAVIDNEVLVN